MPRVYLADKDTLDNVNDKVGTSSDTASSAPTTLFAGIKSLISTLATHVANWTEARAAKIDKLDNLGATGDTSGSTSAGTIMAKLNALLTSWTSTRAGYLDNIRSYTITNNTASKTGVLSAKLAYIISLLENATYGLSAIKSNSPIITVNTVTGYSNSSTVAKEVLNLTGKGFFSLLYTTCSIDSVTIDGKTWQSRTLAVGEVYMFTSSVSVSAKGTTSQYATFNYMLIE